MILRDERIAQAAAGNRLRARVRYALIGLISEALVGSPLLACLGLIGLALALQTIMLQSPGHFRPAGTGANAVFICAEVLLSLAACFVATLPLRRLLSLRARRALAGAAFLSLGILSVIGLTQAVAGTRAWIDGAIYTNDGAVMDLYAARQALDGRNPYKRQNIVTALAAINAPCTTTTPLMDGQFRDARAYPSAAAVQQVCLNVLLHRPRTIPPEFESKYNYPAGSFVFILPFVWAGVYDMRFLFSLAMLLMGVYLWWRMPRSMRPLVPLVLLSNVPLIVLTAGGQPDPIYVLFLMLALAEWRTGWLSPVALGLAVSTKQIAWFFVPFYFVFMLRQYGLREALRRCGVAALIFAVTNGPFIAQAPGSYVSSISGPMADPMFPLGIGVIALFVSNVLPMLPKIAFSATELVVWLGSIAAAARFRLVTLAGSSVLAALPLFFAWRSLINYFYLIPFLALAVVLADSAHRASRPREA
jgi:uncharacterized membrane protein